MAEATQYKFNFTELAALLVKERGIHEGVWMATVEFNFGASLMGPTPSGSLPTANVQIPNVVLQVAPPGLVPETPGYVDAASVNPKPKRASKA